MLQRPPGADNRDLKSNQEKKMKNKLIFGFAMAMSITAAYGAGLGIAANGTCEVGSCRGKRGRGCGCQRSLGK